MDENGRVVELLQGIWGEMKSLNGRIDRVREDLGARIDGLTGRVDVLTERLDTLSDRVERGFEQVDRRFDQLLLGEHGREHHEFRERLARLEAQAGLPAAPPR